MMLIKWRTGGYREPIERVECTRETDSTVWVLEKQWHLGQSSPPVERMRRKGSGSEVYHSSWEEAHHHLIQQSEAEVRSAERRLNYAKDRLQKTLSILPPEDQK